MKKVIIKEVTIKGFKSIAELTYKFEETGINLIKGHNGAGKTTLLDAIYWGLYGSSLKEGTSVLTWPEYGGKGYLGCLVAISLTVEKQVIEGKKKSVELNNYLFIRTHKYKGEVLGSRVPNDFLIYLDDGESLTPVESRLKKSRDEFAIEILGVTKNVFLNSILMGQRMDRFISAKPDAKREILDELFGLDYLDLAHGVASGYAQEQVAKTNSLVDKVESLESRDRTLVFDIEKIKRAKEKWEEEQKEELGDIKKEVEEIEAVIKKRTQEVSERGGKIIPTRSRLQEQLDLLIGKKTQNKVTENNSEISNTIRKEDSLLDKLNPICPVCKTARKVKPEEREEIEKTLVEIRAKKSDLITQREALEKEQKEDSERYNSLKLELEETQKELNSIKFIESEIEMNRGKISTLQAFLDKKKNQGPPPVFDTFEKEEEIKDIRKSIEEIKEEYKREKEVWESYNFWVKTGFASNGLKNYMFNSLLATLNKYVEKYATYFDFSIEFSMNLDKARKTFVTRVTKRGVEVDYRELSGGEKARMDIALSFAIHQMLSSTSVKFNLLFMDEFFEGLEESGLYAAFELMRDKAKENSIFIVSHSNALDMFQVNTIQVTNQGGLSIYE